MNSCSDKNFISPIVIIDKRDKTVKLARDSKILIKSIHRLLNFMIKSLDCIIKIVSGECTGTYRFITGFYGSSDMPSAFQKVMDYPLFGLLNTHCFFDDIIVVSRGSREDHLQLVMNV